MRAMRACSPQELRQCLKGLSLCASPALLPPRPPASGPSEREENGAGQGQALDSAARSCTGARV